MDTTVSHTSRCLVDILRLLDIKVKLSLSIRLIRKVKKADSKHRAKYAVDLKSFWKNWQLTAAALLDQTKRKFRQRVGLFFSNLF